LLLRGVRITAHLAPEYSEQDGTNSVTSLSSNAGALANTYSYDSFGKLTASSSTITNPFQFTGREFDQETTIYFYRSRYYDPNVGRFFSEDPIRFSGGPDFYAYVRNSPIGLIDPSGTDALAGDVQTLVNLFPGSHLSPDGTSLTVPMPCKDVRERLLAQGYQDSNSWGYNGPLSAFWNPFDHRGGWEWRTFGPGFHFRMQYNQPNPFSKCPNQSCTLDQFHIDPHNPLEPGQTWNHVICDFLHWCGQ
jgi:RHS repeat-associated protein